jgi:hypothetical protein
MSFTQRMTHVTRKSYVFFSQFWSKSSHGRTSNIIRGNDYQKWLFLGSDSALILIFCEFVIYIQKYIEK